MKKIILTLNLVLMTVLLLAQAPNSFNYQAAVRDTDGKVLTNKAVTFRISIIETSTNGNIVYQETHNASTSDYGLVNLKIGNGTITSGTFSSIDWGNNSHFIRTELDANGGTNYTIMSNQQLMSVPYALSVANDKVDDADADPLNEIQTLNLSGNSIELSKGGGSIAIPNDGDSDPANEIQQISASGGSINLSKTGGSVDVNSLGQWQKNGSNELTYSNGNIGIGTTTPAGDLEIHANSSISDPQLYLHEDGNDYARIKFDNSNGSNYWGVNAYIASNPRNDRLNFWNGANGDLLTLTGDGRLGLNVGISPKTSFHIGDGERVLFGADTMGPGYKLMFLPDLKAFRVGNINTGAASTYWNRDSIGQYSFASGYNTRAQGFGATAMGRDCEGYGSYSFASGYFTNADGLYSTAMGFNTDARATGSVALGYNADADANYSIGIGYSADAQAEYSVAIGNYARAESYSSMAVGRYNTGGGDATAWVATDPLFEIGNGSSSARANAMTVLKNGNVGIGLTNPEQLLHVNGQVRFAGAEYLVDGGSNEIECRADMRPSTDNLYDLGTSTMRWDDIYATNGIVNTSDRRLKENITPIHYGLEDLLKLRPVSFTWIDKPQQGVKLGLIAQELQEVIGEVVKSSDYKAASDTSEFKMVDQDRLGVYYSDLIPVLIKSIQEQNELITNQEDANAKQEATIAELQKQIAELATAVQTLTEK